MNIDNLYKKRVLVKIGRNDAIQESQVWEISPNKLYVNLISDKTTCQNIGWTEVAGMRFMDVLED